MERVQVVVAHHDCATVRVGDVFLKMDGDQARTDVEVKAMALAPVPTPAVLWRKPPVLALAALPGAALGCLGEPSAAPTAAGAVLRMLHDAPLPPWPGRSLDAITARLDGECAWLIANSVLPAELVTRNRQIAEAALRPWTPVFTHGDALYDLATLTLGHQEHLSHVVDGYGADVDLDVIRGWWSLRGLQAARWLIEHGFDPSAPGCEFDVLRSQMA